MSLPRPIRIECSRAPAAGHKRRPARGTFPRACLLAALLALPPVLLVALVALPRWRAAAQRASAAAGAGPWDPSGRITLLRAQVASRPRDPEAYLALARACVQAEADCDAAEAYAKAIELGAGGAGVHRQLGDAYRRLGDVAEAEREYREALRVDSVPAGPALALIELYLEAAAGPHAKASELVVIESPAGQKEAADLARR